MIDPRAARNPNKGLLLSSIACLLLAASMFTLTVRASEEVGPLLIHGATGNATGIVFSHAGRLWTVPREGGEATLLHDAEGDIFFPCISPDGSQIAFSQDTGRNFDVFVMPVGGGEARRLTYHPIWDRALGWSPEGERILFSSERDGDNLTRLYSISAAGTFPSELPLPQGAWASLSPDGARLAYSPFALDSDLSLYRYYRGGLTSPLWIADLSSGEVEIAAGADANHWQPQWIEDKIYFLSDASGTFNLSVYDTGDGSTRALTDFRSFGIRSLSTVAGGDALLFVRDGRIHLFDRKTGSSRQVPMRLSIDSSEREARTLDAASFVEDLAVSADGRQLALEARGDILTFDIGTGASQNLTASSDAADRSPAWSPDGRWIATFSDAGGEYRIRILPVAGPADEPREEPPDEHAGIEIPIEETPSFYRQLVWSPTGRRLAFTGKRLGLWVADVDTRTVRRVEQSTYLAQELYDPSWSLDGRYLAYSKGFANHHRSVFILDLVTGERQRVSGESYAIQPVFDANGKYLHFLASNTAGLAAANEIWSLLSANLFAPQVTYSVHSVILQEGEPAPVLAWIGQAHPEARPKEVTADPRIDFDGIEKRVVRLPVKELDSFALAAAGPGELLLRSRQWPEAPGGRDRSLTPLYRLSLGEEELFRKVVEDVDDFRVSADASTLAYRSGDDIFLMPLESGEPRKLEGLDQMKLTVSPEQEWRQMYDEAWRLMRDYFYDLGHHGQDLAALQEHFLAYLPGISRRGDLTLLFREMLGQISISHMRIGSGQPPESRVRPERTGALGADFEVDEGRYRIRRIFESAPASRTNLLAAAAPLDRPGMDVKVGEYLLAIDGEDVDSRRNLFSYLVGKAGQPTELKVGPRADGQGARTVLVVPTPGDNSIRREAFYRKAAEQVEELSGGRLGYIPLPQLGHGSVQEFIRDFVAFSRDKEGLILDQRYGPGGTTADTLIQLLLAPELHRYAFPYGDDFHVPTSRMAGPKVLLINEQNASASETFPLMFKIAGVGTLVGKRTMGAGTGGALSYPRLLDGERIVIPNRAAYDPESGMWVENRGVAPDVEVEWWPKDWREGRDPQLETAVHIALEEASRKSAPAPGELRPPYPIHP